MIEVKKIEPGKEVYCKGSGLNCNECKSEKCFDPIGKKLIESKSECEKILLSLLEASNKILNFVRALIKPICNWFK